MSSSTKSISLLCDTNQKLKVQGGVNSFVFDASSGTGGITWPDGTTQTTAATDTTYTIAAAQSGSDADIQLDASTGTDTTVKLAAGSNITLTESGGDTVTIAASGGGGGTIGGSIAEDQVAVGSSTADEIEGNAGYTASLGSSGDTNVLKYGYSDGTVGYTRFRLNGTNAYVEFRDASDNQKGAIGFQSTQGLKFYAKAGGLGATEALRITPDDEWMLNGTNVGDSGQVLTSGGSGSAVTWADAPGTGAVTVGTYAGNNNVAYFSDTTEISNTNNISVNAVAGSLDCFGSIEAGNVKIGTDTNKNTVETSSAQDLVLRTNGGTNSGTIAIKDGVDGTIELVPNGTGTVDLGNYKFDVDQTVSASEDNYVLTYDDASGLISLEAAGGGGGSPGGSDTQLQYNDGGSFGGIATITWDDTAGAEQLLISDSSTSPLVKIEQTGSGAAFEVHDQATDSSIFAVDPSGAVLVGYASGTGTVLKFLVSGSAGADYFLAATDGNASTPVFSRTNESDTGLFFPSTNNTLAITNGGSETFRFGASGDILIGGTDAGTSGQVLTSGGSGAPPTWGGAGSGFKQPAIATGSFLTSNNKYPCFSSAPYGTSNIIDSDTSADYDTNPCMRPFVLAEGGTWGGVAINVVSASTSNALLVSLYESDSDGMPTAFLGYCDIATDSTGNITQTTTLDSGGSSATITLTKDTQYWCSFVAKASSDTCTLMSVAADSLSGFGGANMQNEYTLLRNTFVSNDIETNNPPRNTQTLSDRDAPNIGIII